MKSNTGPQKNSKTQSQFRNSRRNSCSKYSKLGEFRVLTLREGPWFGTANKPARIADYYLENIVTDARFNTETETLVCVAMNARREILGHSIVANGLLDTVLCHPREVFRAAIIANSAAIVIIHNHPSGDPNPSEPDIKITRDLIRAGQILKIEVLDHLIMGCATPERPKTWASLRELGYFFADPMPPTPKPARRCRKKSKARR
jgi:hypothetical protein